MGQATENGAGVLTPGAPEPAADAALPLAMSQREVWLDHCAWPGSAHLNIGGGCFLVGPLDLALFRRALRDLVAECDALRLVPQPDGTQRLLAHYEPPLEEADLSHASDPRRAMRDWGARRIRAEYALGTTPPWRFALLAAGPQLHGVTILFHHTIMDGWGTTLVLRRWAEHYNALLAGTKPPERGADYLQFVADTQKYQAGPGYKRDAEYWLKQLGPTPPDSVIERRHHATAAQGLPPAHLISHGMERARYARLSAAATARGLTPFVCFLAGLALYLSRSSGRQELLIGVPCLNRLGQRFKQTLGMFVGVMPLRITLTPGMGAGELLAHVAHQLQEGLRHSRYPLSELGRQLQLMRLGRDSLLEVMISFERQDYGLHYGEARLTDPYQLFNGWARYPLAITVCEFAADDAELARDPALVIEASAACFSPDETAMLAQRLWWTAQQLIDGPSERPLADIVVMPPAEAAALVTGLHKDLAQIAAPQTFIEQFEQQAALRPHAPALIWDEGELSYAELNQRADRVAIALHAAGAGPERIVAAALPRSPELVVALLAIAKAGAAFLPMNPETPPARLREILEDSGALALMLPLQSDAALSELHPLTLRVRPVLMPAETPSTTGTSAAPVAEPAWRRAAPHELAYVLYTSGSTGGPKGVLMPHSSLSRRLAWLARTWGIDSHDRAAQTTQPSFDPALIELLLPLTVGASVALPPPGRLHPRRLAEFILRHGATFCALVPSTLSGLLSGIQSREGRESLKLRVCCCGGEVLPAELANRFIAETGARLYNVYGPTEAAIFATAWPCVTSPTDAALPLGRPIDDTRIYVLDESLRPQPFGVGGEIYIGGGALARGYLGRPDLDRDAFVTDPFVPGERMYRSGDRGWLDAQGLLHFAGRADRQIKLRGYRIEPGDIELACLAVPGVEQAFVRKVERNGAPRLHAWVAASGTLTQATLLTALNERLPDYMVPAGVTLLPELPLTATGKIDARALPEPLAMSLAAPPSRAVLSALEQQLRELWQQALGRPEIGPQDNFFDLGGDSLAALEILGTMEQKLGRSLSLQLVTQHPTIEDMARALGHPEPLPGMVQALGSGSATTPLYICASGYGDVMRFQTLARALHGLLDVHMLQPARDHAARTPRELAERYADCIASRGLPPGWLAGFSVGGIAALETSRVLQERGQGPLGLLLLDTIHPDAVLGGTSSWRTLGWLVHRLHVEDLSMNGRRLGAMFSDPGLVAQVMALRGYRCSGVTGPALLIKSSGLDGWGGLFFRTWHRLLPQLQTTEVRGLHGSIFEAARVGELARAIQQFTLARAVITGDKS